MSLSVWLPLNGNTNNQGAQGDLVVDTAPAYVNGLLGQAMSTGKLTIPATMSQQIFSSPSVSFCFWIKPTGTTGSQCIFGADAMAAGNNRMYSIFLYPSANDLHFSWQSQTSDGTFASGICQGVFPNNKWTHCAITYNGSIITVYINGVVQGTWNANNTRTNFAYDYPINNSTLRYLNDFRIYNHCLSAKEVKELAKGLILHYKLDDPYIESTTNLFSSINTSLDNAPIGTTTLWENQADGAQAVVEFNGKKCFKLTYNGNANRFYITTSNPTVKATYSCKMYCESWANVSLHIERYPNYSWGGGTTSYTTPGKWQTVSLTLDNSYAGETCYFFIQGSPAAPVYICDIQVETKDHATPYTSSSRNEDIVYDCSGYGNHGTKSGAFSTQTDSPRYSASTKFNGDTNSILFPFNTIINTNTTFTINWWFYKNAWGAKGYETLLGGPSGFEIEAKHSTTNDPVISPHNWGGSTSVSNRIPYELNKWNMVTMRQNSGSSVEWFLNGELKLTTTGVSIPSGNYYIGAWNTATQQNFLGNFSDVRIYATALSTTDIKELYETSGAIDNLGNAYAREVIE